MSNIQLYSNETFSVRTTQDDNGTMWFVAKDIAGALEYTLDGGMSKYFANVPDCWKGGKRIATPGGEQEMLCLTEQGVYFFLGRSDKPKALPYQMWIAGDVVPSIRETGSYSVSNDRFSLKDYIEGAAAVLEKHKITDNQLVLALDKVYKRFTGFSALEATGTQLITPDKHQLLTPTEIGKHFGINPRKVNDILAGAGFQHKINGSWEPLGEGENYAVMQDVGKAHSDGVPVRQLKWTTDILSVFKTMLEEGCA